VKFEIGEHEPTQTVSFKLKVIDEGDTVALEINGIMVLFFSKSANGSVSADFSNIEGRGDRIPFSIGQDGYLVIDR
jgi:hypothetical protein